MTAPCTDCRTVVLVDVPNKSVGRVLATTPEADGIDDMRFNDGAHLLQRTITVAVTYSNTPVCWTQRPSHVQAKQALLVS